MTRSHACLAGLAAWIWGLLAMPAGAQLPQTRLYAVFPGGGQAGSEFELTVTAGDDLEEINQLVFTQPGISARPKTVMQDGVATIVPRTFLIQIDGTTPPGVCEVSCGGLWGFSNPRRFVVGQLPEILEPSNHQTNVTAAPLSLETVVNGSLREKNEVDWFQFSARQGQRVVLDCWTERIDSRLDAALTLYDATGRRRLAASRGSPGNDPVLVFDIPADGSYLLKLHDVTFRSGPEYLYRLEVHSGPFLEFAFPPAGTAGTSSLFTLYGYNLPQGQRTGLRLRGAELEQVQVSIPVPEQADSLLGEQRISAAVAGTDAFSYRLQSAGRTSNPVLIGISALPVISEQESIGDGTPAQAISLPIEIGGQFGAPGDQDRFRFPATAGQWISIESIADRLGTGADPVLNVERVVTREGGGEDLLPVAMQDDLLQNLRPNYFETQTTDAALLLKVAETGLYQVTLRDRYWETRGNPGLAYRLIVRPSQPDFRLVAVPGAPAFGQVWPLALRKGDHFPVTVYAFRRDGYSGSITISAEQLPPGLTCPDVVIGENAASATLVLQAAEDAQPGWQDIQLRGTAAVIDPNALAAESQPQSISHRVRAATVVRSHDKTTPAICRLASSLRVTILDELAPLQITSHAPRLEVYQGLAAVVPVSLQRRGSFTEAVKLTAQELPPQSKVEGTSVFEKDIHEQEVRIRIADNTPPGTFTTWLQGDAEVPYRRNPGAAERWKQTADADRQEVAAARAAAETAAKAKEEAARLLMLANRQVQQAQMAASLAQQQLAAARQEVEKAELLGRQSGAALGTAEQQLTSANTSLTESAARLQLSQQMFSVAEAAVQDIEISIQTVKMQITSIGEEEPPAGTGGDQSSGTGAAEKDQASNEMALQLARKKLSELESLHVTLIQNRDALRPGYLAAKVEQEARAKAQKVAMTAHDQAFQAHETARQKLAALQTPLKQADQAARTAQQALNQAQDEATRAERKKTQAEADDKAVREMLQAAEDRLRLTEKKASDAERAAQPRNVSFTPPSTPVVLVVRAAPLRMTASIENAGQIHAGKQLQVRVQITRQNGFTGAVTLHVAGLEMESGVTSSVLELNGESTAGVITLSAADDARLGPLQGVFLRAATGTGPQTVAEVPLSVTIVQDAK